MELGHLPEANDKEVLRIMESNFAQLEEKVLKAVRLIQELRAENSELQRKKSALQEQYEALQEDNQRLSRELEQSRLAAASAEQFAEKRRQIEEKVGGLLEKLEEIG